MAGFFCFSTFHVANWITVTSMFVYRPLPDFGQTDGTLMAAQHDWNEDNCIY